MMNAFGCSASSCSSSRLSSCSTGGRGGRRADRTIARPEGTADGTLVMFEVTFSPIEPPCG